MIIMIKFQHYKLIQNGYQRFVFMERYVGYTNVVLG